jgi:hypothetical protein
MENTRSEHPLAEAALCAGILVLGIVVVAGAILASPGVLMAWLALKGVDRLSPGD